MDKDLGALNKEQLVAMVKELSAKKAKALKWEAEMPKVIALIKKEFPSLSDKERANLLSHSGWHYLRLTQALK